MIELTDREFNELSDFVKVNFGLDLSAKKTFVQMRMQRFVTESGFDTFHDYFNFVCNDASGIAVSNFVSGLTVNYTHFCREAYHFDFVRDELLPRLFIEEQQSKDLRIWSAGCSSGEEPYTLAMIVADFLGFHRQHWDAKILATDISTFALTKALAGAYPRSRLEGLDPKWIERYFAPDPADRDGMLIAPTIRGEVIFRKHNLAKDTFNFKKKYHFIFCRNVMIYFDDPTKYQVIQQFYDNLREGGYLFIGMSETLDHHRTPFKYVRPAIYRKGEGGMRA